MLEGTIRLFRPPAITVDGEDKLQVTPVKGFALLVYLCMEGGKPVARARFHTDEIVIADIGPDDDPEEYLVVLAARPLAYCGRSLAGRRAGGNHQRPRRRAAAGGTTLA